MADSKLEDVAVTTTEETLVVTPLDHTLSKSLFMINKGTNEVVFRIYGSPTGATSEMNGPNGARLYTDAEIALHYTLIVTITINASENHVVILSDYPFNYLKITVQASTATSTINYALQKASASDS